MGEDIWEYAQELPLEAKIMLPSFRSENNGSQF